MSSYNRHLMKGQAGADDDSRYLRYWWCGEDAPTSGDGKYWWHDRLQDKTFGSTDNQHKVNAYVLDGSGLQMYSTLSFGRHFRIVFDATVTVFTDSMAQRVTFADFDSITSSSKGFSCGLRQSAGCPSMNYKMFGNGAGAPYDFPDGSFPFEKGQTIDGIFEFGNEACDDEHDILWFRFNGGEKIYSNNPHKIIIHNNIGPNSGASIRLNEGVIGSTFDNVRYSQNMTYRDIKIYVYE